MLFQGTIHLPDDKSELDATIEVDAGRVIINSEGQEISRWQADKITLTHRRDGILLTVDGESLIVRPIDRYGFSDAVDEAKRESPKRRLFRRAKKQSSKTEAPAEVSVGAHASPEAEPAPTAAPAARAPLPPVEPPQPSAWPFDDRDVSSEQAEAAVFEPGSLDGQLAGAIETAKANPRREQFADESRTEEVDLTKEIFGDMYAGTDPRPKQRGQLATRWQSIPVKYRVAGLGLAAVALLTVFVPEIVATVLVLAGLASCLIGGAGMADPSYTRKLPPALSEIRLLVGGGILLVVGFVIGLPSV